MYQADEKRYETMKYHRCGASGLMLPELSLGLWHNFGDTGVYENMKQTPKRQYIAGGNENIYALLFSWTGNAVLSNIGLLSSVVLYSDRICSATG